jgi:hypothetical protein
MLHLTDTEISTVKLRIKSDKRIQNYFSLILPPPSKRKPQLVCAILGINHGRSLYVYKMDELEEIKKCRLSFSRRKDHMAMSPKGINDRASISGQ